MSQWISAETPPEASGARWPKSLPVLVNEAGGGISIAMYYAPVAGEYAACWYECHGDAEQVQVTHWMPLPEAPIEERPL